MWPEILSESAASGSRDYSVFVGMNGCADQVAFELREVVNLGSQLAAVGAAGS